MLDLNLIRNDAKAVQEALARREYEVNFDELLTWDARRRAIIQENEQIKADRNRINKEIPRMKKAGEDVTALLEQMKAAGETVKALDAEQKELEDKMASAIINSYDDPITQLKATEEEGKVKLYTL